MPTYGVDDNPLADAISRHQDADALQAALNTELHRATVEMLNSGLPLDVRARNSAVRERHVAAVNEAARYIYVALAQANIDNGVLAGQVAETVKQGMAEIASQNDYTSGIASITS